MDKTISTAKSVGPTNDETIAGANAPKLSSELTGTGTAMIAPSAGGTATGTAVVVPTLPQAAPPDLTRVRGLGLEQLLLGSSVVLVVVIVTSLAVLSTLWTKSQFEETVQVYTSSLEQQARELGQAISRTLSLTSATSLRDNNYALLGEIVGSIVNDNKNVLRVQIFDGEGLAVADSDNSTKLGSQSNRKAVRRAVFSTYKGLPVFEYQEPVDYGSTTGKGVVVVSYSLSPLQAQLQELENTKRGVLRKNMLWSVGLGLAFVMAAVVLAGFQSRRISRPLGELASNVISLAQGNLASRVSLRGQAGREVQTLGLVFNHMADRIAWLLDEARNRAVLQREMQLARKVQETLLPTREALEQGPLRIAGACLTADQCGGDWWLRMALDERRVVFGVGDVTGHGLSTALIAASATSGFAAAAQMSDPASVDANNLITALNQILFHLGRGEYQMSTALAVFDVEQGEIDYAAGGHPSACVYNRGDGKISSLPARGSLLGAAASSQYSSRRAKLRPGDVLVWYTDGLTECRDPQERLYGFQRLCAVVQQHGHLPAEQLRDVIINDVQQFAGSIAQQDDITVVIAEYIVTNLKAL